MGGGGRPRGIFDDVPTIGGGDEPGQGDGGTATAVRGIFDDVPNIGPDVAESDDETPAFSPPGPPPTRLRDRLTGYLDEQPPAPTVTPPPNPDQSWMYERSDAGYTPEPAAKFVTGASKAIVEGIPSIPLEVGKAVFGAPSAEEAADPLMRAGRLARYGQVPEMQPAPADFPNPAERVADIPIGMAKAIPGQVGTVIHDPDWEKKGEAAAGLGMDAAILYGGARGVAKLARGKGAKAPINPLGEGVKTPFDDVPVITEAEAQAMLDRAGQRDREADEISPPKPPEPPPIAPAGPPQPEVSGTGVSVAPTGQAPERVRAAAVEIDGKRYTGPDHFAAVQKAMAAGHDIEGIDLDVQQGRPGQIPGDSPRIRSGYETDRGRFVDDHEGAAIATAAGQTKGKLGKDAGGKDYLDSADLELEGSKAPERQPVIPPTPEPFEETGPPHVRLAGLQQRLEAARDRPALEQLRADITATRAAKGTQPIYSELSVLQGKVTRKIKALEVEPKIGQTAKQERAEKIATGRVAKYEKMPTDELLAEHHRVIDRVQVTQPGNVWTRYDDDVGETRSGGGGSARGNDDRRMLDGITAELEKRGIGEDDRLTSYYEHLDRKGEREGMENEDVGGAGPTPGGDELPFAPGPPPDRAALDRFLEGSVVREPVYHGTRGDFDAFRRTRDIGFHFGTLAQLMKGRLKKSPSANRRLAELDRILNRDQKITADEMSTRARADEVLESPAPRPRPYRLEDLESMSERQQAAALRYEERLAQRELLEREGRGDPGTAAPGAPSKTIADLEVLEHELRAVEKKLVEIQSEKLKSILQAQVFNRTRQQEAYVREWVNAGRADELPDLVRGRFRDMKPGEKEAPPAGGQERSGRESDGRRRAREEWERRMRDEARRRQQERERGRQAPPRGERQRQGPPPPPPRPPPRPKPPPPPSMQANPNVPPPKNAGGRVRSLWRIGRMFSDAMKATVYQGRGRPRFPNHALGFFKLASEAIRVQRADWLDVIAHEVGHHLSKLYLKHPTNKGAFKRGAIPLTPEMMTELRKMGKNLYGDRKAALGYGEEGIAEWAKFYIVDPARAATEAPKFNAFMESTVFNDPVHAGPLLESAFTAAREHYARYEHATPLERIKAMIDKDPSRFKAPEIRNLTTHWLDDLEEFRRFDEAAKVGNARESVYQLARLARGSPARAQSWLTEGMVDIRDGRKVGRSVIDALTEVGEKNFDDFEAYLVAKSAIERWENGINPGPRLDDARAVADQLDARFKKYAEVVWDHYRLLLEAKRDAGQLSPRAFKAILDKNKQHVGFYRVFEDFERPAGGRSGGGRGLQGGPGLPRQKGSARDIISPLESIVTDTYRTAASISRFTALKALVKLSQREGMGHIVDEVPAPIEVTKIYAPHVLEQLQALGLVKLDPITGQVRPLEGSDLMGEVLQAFHERERPGQAELKDLVIPFREGETTRWFQIRERKLYDAVEGLDPVELAGALRWFSAPVRTFRAGVTLTAKFIVKNIFRDAGTAFVRTRSTRPVAPFEHFVTGAFHWLKSPELVERWRESGGDNATMLGLDRPTTSHNLRRLVRQNGTTGHRAFDIVQHPIDAIRSLSSIGENVTRLGEYAIVERQKLKKGLGPREAQTQAGFAARDVTQDFWMAGKTGRTWNQVVAFFNAGVNSVANLGRDMRRRPEVVLPRLAVGITIPSVALYLLQRKDPEYRRIPRWQKDLGWIYVQRGTDRSKGWDGYGPGKVEHRWFIPKPFELGVMFGSTFERIAEWAVTANPDAFDQFTKSLGQALSPNILPHVFALWHELKSNHDDFRDRPIVPRSLEGVDPRYQSRSTTGELARVLGNAAPGRGVSPAKIEHGIQGLTGGVGEAVTGAADAGIRAFREAAGKPPLRERSTIFTPDPDEDPLTEIPGLSGLVRRDPKEMGEDIERLYRTYQRAEQSRQTWLHLLKEGKRKEADEYLRQHRDEIRSVATAEQTGGAPGPLRARYEAITKLRGVSRDRPERRDANVDRMHRLTERR